MPQDTDDRTTNPVDPTKVVAGDMMALIHWAKVKEVRSPDHIIFTDVDTDSDFHVQGRELVRKAFSADQYAASEKISKTAAAEILVSSYNRPLTVVFIKADGTSRTMRCRLIKPEPLLGRSMVEDLDVAGNQRTRLVDHRTIESVIVDGVRYTVK